MTDTAFFHNEMVEFHRRSGRSFPWRDSVDLYEVLVGEVLLQRTRGENVVPIYREFLRRWPTPEKLARARVSTIERVIHPLGLAKRAPTLKSLGQALQESGGVPTRPDGLLKLPGVGPYGAHAVPVFALGRNLPVVDWVIARVLRRYFGLPVGRRPNADTELWLLAEQLAVLGEAREFWLGVLDLSAAVCRRHPLCHGCPVEASCEHAAMKLSE